MRLPASRFTRPALQKPMIAWKTPWKTLSPRPMPRRTKATLSTAATRSSTAKVILAICKRSLRVLRGESTLSMDSRNTRRSRKPTFCPTNKAAMVVTVMIPSPPSWTSTMTTTAPNVVKVAGKSTVERPGTLPELTETNMASTHEMPRSVETGSLRSRVPSAISARKPKTISWAVESLLVNTFSRVVGTQDPRHPLADPAQYTRELTGTGRPERGYNQERGKGVPSEGNDGAAHRQL